MNNSQKSHYGVLLASCWVKSASLAGAAESKLPSLLKKLLPGALAGTATAGLTDPQLSHGDFSHWNTHNLPKDLEHAAFGGLLGHSAAGAMTGELANEARAAAKLGRQGVGRVMTNVISPFGYEGNAMYPGSSHAKEVVDALRSPIKTLKAIWNDKPLYPIGDLGDGTADARWAARELPYRRMFDLNARAGRNIYTKAGPKEFRFNSSDPAGGMLHDQALFSDTTQHAVMGGFDRAKGPNGTDYGDRWDFDLHPGEKLNTLANMIRWALSKITNPIRITGHAAADQQQLYPWT